MPYREVTMTEVKEVLLLWLYGVPKQRIATMLGLDRKTVRRYTGLATEYGLSPGQGPQVLTDERMEPVLVALRAGAGRPRGEGWALCLAHRPFIEEKLKHERLKLTKVHRLLERQGVRIPYATLHRFAVSELSWGRCAPTIPVADCEGGQEVQLDTGWAGRLEPDMFGKRRRFRAWIFAAVRSRRRFVWPCFRETTPEAITACEAAWQAFGGVFRVLVPDNTKAIVDRADSLGASINRTFLEYAQARGFHVDAA
jgi:transposase